MAKLCYDLQESSIIIVGFSQGRVFIYIGYIQILNDCFPCDELYCLAVFSDSWKTNTNNNNKPLDV